jgi:hypothetical protein
VHLVGNFSIVFMLITVHDCSKAVLDLRNSTAYGEVEYPTWLSIGYHPLFGVCEVQVSKFGPVALYFLRTYAIFLIASRKMLG